MLNHDDARVASETNVQALTGSSQPGSSPNVAEMPDTWETLGSAANRAVAAIDARMATGQASSPDAALIKFAGKVVRLIEKEHAAAEENSVLSDRVMRERPYPLAGNCHSAEGLRTNLKWHMNGMTPDAIAVAERDIATVEAWELDVERFEKEIGLERATTKAGHLFGQVEARVAELAEMSAATMDGLAAKVDAARALRTSGDDGEQWAVNLTRTIMEDFARLRSEHGLEFAAVSTPSDVEELQREWLRSSARYFTAIHEVGLVSYKDPKHAVLERRLREAEAADIVQRGRIINLRSAHPDAMKLKAAALLTHCGGWRWIDETVQSMIDEVGLFEEAIAMSLARDIVENLGAPVQVLAAAALGPCSPNSLFAERSAA